MVLFILNKLISSLLLYFSNEETFLFKYKRLSGVRDDFFLSVSLLSLLKKNNSSLRLGFSSLNDLIELSSSLF